MSQLIQIFNFEYIYFIYLIKDLTHSIKKSNFFSFYRELWIWLYVNTYYPGPFASQFLTGRRGSPIFTIHMPYSTCNGIVYLSLHILPWVTHPKSNKWLAHSIQKSIRYPLKWNLLKKLSDIGILRNVWYIL